ncbi:MAG: thermonuclease family protein [Promethearchaeota archaeon]
MRKHDISKTRCKSCGGLISWDNYPNQKWPIHVDENGYKIGNGSCPNFNLNTLKDGVKDKSSTKQVKLNQKIQNFNFKRKLKYIIPICVVGIVLVASILTVGMLSLNLNESEEPPEVPDIPPSLEIDCEGNATYIVDGDTYDFEGTTHIFNERIRLADIDTPESGESGYQEAKDFLTSLIYNQHVYLDIDNLTQTDPYGRFVAVTYVRHNSTHLINVNEALVYYNFASIWDHADNEFDPYSWVLYAYYP